MTGPRLASVCIMLLVLVPSLPLAACDVPSTLLAGRTLSETRRVLRGEVVFVADARLHDFEGRATAVSGRVRARGTDEAVGCVAIQAKALDTGIGLRNRLMWEDHLEVAKFPEIRFLLAGLSDFRREAGRISVTLEGELTLHGVTRPLRIPATVSPVDGRFEVEGRTPLLMSDYGIERPTFLFVTVKDEVEVRFRVLVGEAE
ncbi:MAG: YceI family protein [candidate division NC10 bacterium]|nr:YceI family protein [candidate division NC10 bacterium]